MNRLSPPHRYLLYQKASVALYSETEEESDLVYDMWKTKKSELKKHFQGHEVDLEFFRKNQPMIIIKIADLPVPVSWLLEANLHEKINFARVLHRNYVKIIDFVKEET